MVRLIFGSVISGVVLFFWGFIFWTKLPLGDQMMEPFPNEEALVANIKNLPHSGVYFFPYLAKENMSGENPAALESFVRRHEQGPIGSIYLHKEGAPFMGAMTFILGFVHFVVSSFLAGCLLHIALPALSTWMARFIFVTMLGIFGAVAMNLGSPIWFMHPWKATLIQSVFDVSSWILAGVILGTIIKPRN